MKRTLLINNLLYYFTLLTFACLAYGFLWSRVFYSIGLLFLGVQFLLSATSLKDILYNRYFQLALCIPLCNLVRDGMSNILFINLTIPLYVAFFIANKYKDEWLKNGFLISTVIFFITAIHTCFLYFSDIETTIELYKKAQVVAVGLFNDHIRFSIVVSFSMAVLLYLYANGYMTKWEKLYTKVYFVFMIIFIHLLAARTGLLLLYFMALIFIILKVITSRNYWKLAFLLLLPILPIIAYKIFPSFYHRVGYSVYDFHYYKDLSYREGSSDGIRYYSILSGIDIFKSNPISGVGFENLKPVTNDWYKEKFPIMREDEMMLPHNQYLVYGAAAGFIGWTLLLMLFFYPLMRWSKISIEGKCIILGFAFICLIEMFFDSQLKIYAFGLFIPFAFLHMPENRVTMARKSIK